MEKTIYRLVENEKEVDVTDTDIPEAKVMVQTAPWPYDLEAAVSELVLSGMLTGWKVWLEEEDRGQECHGLTLSILPNVPDSYHPEKGVNTRFIYPVPGAAYNRESWEEWLWARIEETEGHERAEAFGFRDITNTETQGQVDIRKPFKPAHPDGWDPGVIRSVVSDTVTNTPNAGRLVQYPCVACGHKHRGKMGEHFTIIEDRGCLMEASGCNCGKKRDG